MQNHYLAKLYLPEGICHACIEVHMAQIVSSTKSGSEFIQIFSSVYETTASDKKGSQFQNIVANKTGTLQNNLLIYYIVLYNQMLLSLIYNPKPKAWRQLA